MRSPQAWGPSEAQRRTELVAMRCAWIVAALLWALVALGTGALIMGAHDAAEGRGAASPIPRGWSGPTYYAVAPEDRPPAVYDDD